MPFESASPHSTIDRTCAPAPQMPSVPPRTAREGPRPLSCKTSCQILVPVDFSPHAVKALAQAIELAGPLRATIHLLHAYAVVVPCELPHVNVRDFADHVRADTLVALEPLERRLAEAGIDYGSHLSSRAPVAAIVELAQSLPADLIVMGTRGRTDLRHVLLGSVAERTIRLAHCPVLTVKVDGEEDGDGD